MRLTHGGSLQRVDSAQDTYNNEAIKEGEKLKKISKESGGL